MPSPTQIRSLRLATVQRYAERMKHLPNEEFESTVAAYAERIFGCTPVTARSYMRSIKARVGYTDLTESLQLEKFLTDEQWIAEDDKPP